MNSYCCLFRFRNLLLNSAIRDIRTSAKLCLTNSCLSQSTQKFHLNDINKLQFFQRSIITRSCATAVVGNVPHHKKEQHSKVWVTERIVTVVLLGVIPLIFVTKNSDIECIASVLTALHFHWGLEATFTDYLRPSVVGNVIPKYCGLYAGAISMLILTVLLWISVHGNGVVKTLQQLWYLDMSIE